MTNARQTALAVLYNIEYNGAYSNIALKNELDDSSLSGVDKHLVTTLVYGVVKMKLHLDYIIQSYSKIRLKKISKYILLILRLGVYQLMFMDKIPESAAVNESVKLAKRFGHGASAGFVNGILHTVIRMKDSMVYPTDKNEFLSVKYSYPASLTKHWIDEFGEEFAESLMSTMNEPAPLTIRVNTLKTNTSVVLDELSKKNITASVSPFYENAVVCGGFDIASSKLYQDGLMTPQDVSAMLASVVLSPKPGDTIIDMCSAPGGKTTHMAQLMNNAGVIHAFDIHEHKMQLIEKTAQRLGIDIINTKCTDATLCLDEYINTADKVLVDVPCSGLGIIRKKPDIKWNYEVTDITNTQYKILENASKYVKSGGYIVYSTCTIEKRENKDVIMNFINNNPEFETVDIENKLPSGLHKETLKQGHITFYPNVDGIDGFFICKLRKR